MKRVFHYLPPYYKKIHIAILFSLLASCGKATKNEELIYSKVISPHKIAIYRNEDDLYYSISCLLDSEYSNYQISFHDKHFSSGLYKGDGLKNFSCSKDEIINQSKINISDQIIMQYDLYKFDHKETLNLNIIYDGQNYRVWSIDK